MNKTFGKYVEDLGLHLKQLYDFMVVLGKFEIFDSVIVERRDKTTTITLNFN